ncbi:hypothetical protein LguiA_007237 [Lonicera macranthoides]
MTPGDVGGKTSVQGLELFRRIRAESEDSPMAIMIVAVLSGCADIGALDFGRFINGSNMLASEQTPNEITFVSMISACTHAGRLEEAIELIEQMPIDPDAMEWEVEIGRNGGKEDALKMGKIKRSQKINKKPGSSWIEMNGVVHEYLAEDTI